MEVPFTPGRTAIVLNAISDFIAVTASFSFIITMNAYGRWALHRKGRVSMDMHFHDMSFAGAFLNLLRIRRSAKRVVTMSIIQTILFAIVLILKVLAPIGVSESKKLSVQRSHTMPGETVCLTPAVNVSSDMVGMAAERVVKHFSAGGQILCVGRTGRDHNSLVMEDKERSFGPAQLFRRVSTETSITFSDGKMKYESDQHWTHFLTTPPNYTSQAPMSTWMIPTNVTYLPGRRIIDGPLYIVVCAYGMRKNRYESEVCSFSRCSVKQIELGEGESTSISAKCSTANLERETFTAGFFVAYDTGASPLKYLDRAYKGLDVSELGQRSFMINDLALTLASPTCGNTYVAYLPLSEISSSSLVLVSVLGALALLCCMVSMISFIVTRNTFNWNGSYQRVISLAVSSDSTGLPANDYTTVGNIDVVIEEKETYIGKGLHVRIVPWDVPSNPVPGASHKLRG